MKTILSSGKIYIEKNIFAEAALIENGIIREIGTNEEIKKNIVDKIVDLNGKTVLPGLNDSHLHLVLTGDAMRTCNLNSAKSIDDIIKLGRDFLKNNQNIKVLVGQGWNQDLFNTGEIRLLNRFDLDKISSDIPIIFDRVCTHVSASNTKAIEIINIDENTHVDGGEIEIGPDGKPNGVFKENALPLIKRVIPQKDNADIENSFINAANYAISVGLTSVQSCDVMGENFDAMFKLIHKIYDNKKTKLRYSFQYNFQNIEDFKKYIETEFKNGNYDEKFLSKGALKLFKDGSLGARTALMRNNYKDDPTTNGVAALKDEELIKLCELASCNGIRVITHAIGDGAIDSVINAYEKISRNNNELRHGIVHCQITSKDQLKRIAKLNIPVMYQPIFLDYDIQVVNSRVGQELANTSYAFNTLNKIGSISFGTDSPVENCNPFPNIYCAVTRQRINGKPEGGFMPNERMTVEDCIDAYTVGSAFNEFKENFKGRLKPGYVADLIVLDKDIFTIDLNDIKDIKVEKTMIDGEFVYEK